MFLWRRTNQVNRYVRVFIASEVLVWSAWNFIFPIIAVFIVNEVAAGSVEVAAIAMSFYLVSRVMFELFSSKYFVKSQNRNKLVVSIIGQLLLSAAYLAFIVIDSISALYLVYALLGLGLGIASPAKFSLFSMHLDQRKEAFEWSLYDALTFGSMAIAGVIGGFIAKNYGFDFLFVMASAINLFGLLPYLFLLRKIK